MSYTDEQKLAAIKAYLRNNKNALKTVKELGYPTTNSLISWYRQYKPEPITKPQRQLRRYSDEEKKKATDLYFKNGCNIKKTVRELGYGSQTALLQWLRQAYPDKVSKLTTRGYRPDVPEEIKSTFDKLGIPEAEKKSLAGVGAQYDSEVVYHSMKEDLLKQGVIYTDMETAVREYPQIVKEHFMKCVPITDHKFVALHAAVWSGGSFVYVTKGVKVDIPL